MKGAPPTGALGCAACLIAVKKRGNRYSGLACISDVALFLAYQHVVSELRQLIRHHRLVICLIYLIIVSGFVVSVQLRVSQDVRE